MTFIFQLLSSADTVFQLVLAVLLLRGPFRKYPVFSAYAVAELLAYFLEWVMYYRIGWRSPAYRQLFWADHIALDLLLLLVLIALTYHALGESPLRSKVSKILAGIVVVALALPFAMLGGYHDRRYGFFTSQWFNHVSQILNFGAAIMNLILWGVLLSNRRRDAQLVTLSIGLGLVTASAAITWGVREFLAEGNRWPMDTFLIACHLLALLLWCSAFRKAGQAASSAPPGALASPSQP